MTPRLDLTGMNINGLTFVKRTNEKAGSTYKWVVECYCGVKFITNPTSVKLNKTLSCGCSRKKHGDSTTRLYGIWNGMRHRCLDKKHISYHRYGGRGIKVCEEWDKSYENFKEWAINNGYQEELSIDRIDNDKDYSPSNCKWSSIKEQCNNRENNNRLTFNGVSKTVAEWSVETGLPYHTIHKRILHGWEVKDILTKEKRQAPQVIFVGHHMSSTYMSELFDVLEDKDVSINIISKSGTTTEPAIAFRIFKKLLEEKYGKEEAKQRIYATTDKARGALKTDRKSTRLNSSH